MKLKYKMYVFNGCVNMHLCVHNITQKTKYILVQAFLFQASTVSCNSILINSLVVSRAQNITFSLVVSCSIPFHPVVRVSCSVLFNSVEKVMIGTFEYSNKNITILVSKSCVTCLQYKLARKNIVYNNIYNLELLKHTHMYTYYSS